MSRESSLYSCIYWESSVPFQASCRTFFVHPRTKDLPISWFGITCISTVKRFLYYIKAMWYRFIHSNSAINSTIASSIEEVMLANHNFVKLWCLAKFIRRDLFKSLDCLQYSANVLEDKFHASNFFSVTFRSYYS